MAEKNAFSAGAKVVVGEQAGERPGDLAAVTGVFRIRSHPGMLALLALAFLLALLTSIVNPPFEATDELEHYRFVRYLIDERRLPVQPDEPQYTQYHHPPLYYLGGALMAAAVEDQEEIPPLNPHWLSYRPGSVHPDNKTRYLRTAAIAFPYYGTALVVHLIRLWSVLLAGGTLLLLWRLAFFFWPKDRINRLLFLALAGLNPMFLYLSGSANNDNLVIFLGTLMLWLSLEGIRRRFPWSLTALVGIVWGLALLTKLNGLLLVAPWAVALLWSGWQQRSWRFLLGRSILVALIAALLAGWWFLRNLNLYGEPFGLERMLEIWGQRPPGDLTLRRLYDALLYSWESFWGRFGYGQIVLPRPLYWFFTLVTVLGLLGVLQRVRVALTRRELPRQAAYWSVIVVFLGVYVAGLLYYLFRSPTGYNGRYLFPALAAFAAILVWGMDAFSRLRWLRPASIVLLTAAALFSLGWLLPWTYAPPPALTEAEARRRVVEPQPFRWDPGIRIVGTQIDSHLRPGDAQAEVVVSACWQAEVPLERNYTIFMHLLDVDLNILGARNTHAGLGTFPTSLWQPGATYCERYRMPVDRQAVTTAQVGSVDIGLFDQDPSARLPVTSGPLSDAGLAIVGRVKVPPLTQLPPPLPPHEVDFTLARGVRLVGYDWSREAVAPGETVVVKLWWHPSGPLSESYTVLADLLGPGGEQLARSEQVPGNGRYPTDFWADGELVVDEHSFLIPPEAPAGELRLQVGLYEPGNLPRVDEPATPSESATIPGPVAGGQ